MDVSQRSDLVKMVRQWGDITTDAILDPHCQFFTLPGIEGFIGYRLEFGTAIVMGDPVCAEPDKSKLADAFKQYCIKHKFGLAYGMISEQLADCLHQDLGASIIQFGYKITVNPQKSPFERTGTKASLVRRKVRHAAKEGVEILEYVGHNLEIEAAMEAASQTWLASREGPQVHISVPRLFSDRQGKRWFYAQKNGKIVGVFVANRLEVRQGWLCNHLMPLPNAPGGTPESLVTKAMEVFAKEGCTYVTFGAFSSEKLERVAGMNPLSLLIIKGLYYGSRLLLRFDGHKNFWEKFEPALEPAYLAIINKKHPIRMIRGVCRALNITL